MTDDSELIKKIKDPIEFLITNYFDIMYRGIRLNTFRWALENLDEYWSKITDGGKVNEDEFRQTLIEYLQYEMIFTNMQMAEDLVRVIMTYRYGCPDRAQTFSSSINAKAFYDTIHKKKDDFFIDILSIPPGPWIWQEKVDALPPNEVLDHIHKFKLELIKIGEFYRYYYELYNRYKHGNRLGYITSPQEDGTNFPAVLSLPIINGSTGKRGQIIVNTIRNSKDDPMIGYKMLKIAEVIKKNWINGKGIKENQDFTITIPHGLEDI